MLKQRFLLVIFLVACIVLPLSAQQNNQVTHIVAPGENLYRISLRYGISMDDLARANNIVDRSSIYSGQELVIPGLEQPNTTGDVVENPLVAGTPEIHVVQPGETLTAIANQYGITVDQILQANNFSNPNRIERGQELYIWTPQTVDQGVQDAVLAGEPPQNNIIYVVQEGEHLSQIAQRYGMDWTTLAQMNNIINADQLYAGQEIIVPALNADGGIADMGIISAPLVNYYVPTPSKTEGRQIVVDLSESRIYAFENGLLLKSTVVSTGLPGTPTVQGEFSIWHRTESQTMSGPGYYLPNVQWVQYFYQGYGIHGTYWHNNFGQPMSHGCVNLPNADAEWFYSFGELGMSVLVQA